MNEPNANLNPRGRGDETSRRPGSPRESVGGGVGSGGGGAVDPLDLYFDGELPRLSKPVREALRGSPERRRELDETRKVLADLGRGVECPDFTLSVLDAVDARRPFLSPKSRRLVTWSRVAVAACVVLAAGAVAVASRLNPGVTDGAAPIADLERGVALDAQRASGWNTPPAIGEGSGYGSSTGSFASASTSERLPGEMGGLSGGSAGDGSARAAYAVASGGGSVASKPSRVASGLAASETGPRLLAVSPEMSEKLQKLASSWSVSDTRVVRVTIKPLVDAETMPLVMAGGSGGELLVDQAWIDAERARLASGVRPNLLRDGSSACLTVRGVLEFDAVGGEIAALQNASAVRGFEMKSPTLAKPAGRGFVPVAGVSVEWLQPWTAAAP